MSQEITIIQSSHVDLAIEAWLQSKLRISGSRRTHGVYTSTIRHFQELLAQTGRSLDPAENARDHTQESLRAAMAEIALAAQGYCGMSVEPGKIVAGATFNQRRATLSSFYDFASKRGFFLCGNPVAAIERAKIESYAYAQPLAIEHVKASMAAIDRSTKHGRRDYALLSILLSTGRRLTEVTQLVWSDVQLQGDKALVTFHCKGAKIKRDLLSATVTVALVDWLRFMYLDLNKLDPATPLWISFTRKASDDQARPSLTTRSVANICQARLGTSKVHTTRHTWARTAEDAGVKISDIQYELGHASLATTGRYLQALKTPDSKHGDTMADLFGL